MGGGQTLMAHPPRLLNWAHPRWVGDRRSDNSGYVRVYCPGHPRANASGRVLEHVLLAEKALGRPLISAHEVHHVNGKKDDNRPANLVICESTGYHRLLHYRARALNECGNANWMRCEFCKRWGDPEAEDMWVAPHGTRGFHRACSRAHGRDRKAARRAVRLAVEGEARIGKGRFPRCALVTERGFCSKRAGHVGDHSGTRLPDPVNLEDMASTELRRRDVERGLRGWQPDKPAA